MKKITFLVATFFATMSLVAQTTINEVRVSIDFDAADKYCIGETESAARTALRSQTTFPAEAGYQAASALFFLLWDNEGTLQYNNDVLTAERDYYTEMDVVAKDGFAWPADVSTLKFYLNDVETSLHSKTTINGSVAWLYFDIPEPTSAEVTAIDQVEIEKAQVRKIVENGVIYIVHPNGEKYTLTGQRAK